MGLVVLVLVLVAWSVVSSGIATHRLGGRGQPRRFRRFYRTGVVPPDARTDRWVAVLEHQRRIARRPWRLLGWAAAALTAVLAVAIGLPIAASDARPTVLEVVITVAPLVLVLATFSAILVPLNRRRIPRMDQRIATLRAHRTEAP